MSKYIQNIEFDRKRFELINNFYGKKGITPQTQQLRIAVPFGVSKGSYIFNPKKDPSLALLCENLLKVNDLFAARAMGLAIMVETTGAEGQAPLYSYPVLASLALPTGYKGLTDTKAHAVYNNGKLIMKTGQTVNNSGFPVSKCLHIPQMQPSIVWNGTAAISAQIAPEFELENVLYELPELISFAGTRDQSIELLFPACTIAGEAGTIAYAVLIIDGWLLEGGANKDFAVDGNPFLGQF